MPDLLTLILVIAGILLAIALSAFFSGAEMALSACNRVRLENEKESGDRKSGTALRLAERFDDTLSTVLIGNNLVNTASSSLSTVLVILLSGSDRFAFVATIVITILVIIFGETIPKIVSKKAPTRRAKAVAYPIAFLRILFFPLSIVVVGLVKLLTFWMKEKDTEEEDESTEELQSIIDTAENEGVLDSEQSELVSAAIDFSEISADEVMTARVDMIAINVRSPKEEIVEQALESSVTRVPVYDGSIDKIIGVVHLNHFLKALSENPETDIRTVMMEPCFIYRTTKLPQVLDNLKKSRQHLAIVTDEYSGTLGVISMEDVLETIVGDIWDETDEVEEEVETLADGELSVDGDMNVGDFLELLSVPEEDFEYESQTAGGLVIELFGDFPKVGDTVSFGDYDLTVSEMDERRVEKIRIRKKAPEAESASGEEEKGEKE